MQNITKNITKYRVLNRKTINETMFRNSKSGFTIVELLVVIVVIGILAAISIVSYSGITNRAKVASIQSDLASASKQLKVFYVDNGVYPATISTNCAVSPTTTTNLCFKPSMGNDFTSTPYSRPTDQSFILTVTNGALVYHITEDSAPTAGIYVIPSLATIDPANWIAVGTQVWARYNSNVGTMILNTSNQTNNASLEKYCYSTSEANCTLYGGLYQWDEAMQYVTTEGARGICPEDSHIPTDDDWRILSLHLGMTPAEAAGTGWRGNANEGTKLLSGGASGLNFLLGGFRNYNNPYMNISAYTYIWSSTEYGGNVWTRGLSTDVYVNRDANAKSYGFVVRCVAD